MSDRSEWDNIRNSGPGYKFAFFVRDFIEKPLDWIHDNIVEKNRKEYYWYHQQYRRVPTIDECYLDDSVCIYEANEQYKRDRSVDKGILNILRRRYENCEVNSQHNPGHCLPLYTEYTKAIDNYFIKYGDLGMRNSAINCYMKQKHRMAWERRHGPVGTGKKETKKELFEETD